jgi:hypothetical protein
VIEAKLFLCSDSAAIDQRSNTLSVFHISEHLLAAAFPVAIPRLDVIAILTREMGDPDRADMQLIVYRGEQELLSTPWVVHFLQQTTARALLEMNGVVVPAPGDLRFLCRIGERTLASWTISVVQAGQPGFQPWLLPQPPVGQPT